MREEDGMEERRNRDEDEDEDEEEEEEEEEAVEKLTEGELGEAEVVVEAECAV